MTQKKWKQDGGHGGKDPGAVSHGNIEKEYTLEASLYVDKRLAEHGIPSDVTRTGDTTLEQSERTAMVRKYKKCISHHYNAGGGSGAEAIHSIHSDGKFEHMIIEEFKKAGYPVRPRSVFFKKNSRGGDYYYMHRETGACRTTIIEYDFVDGPQADKIKDKAYREGMYECVIRAICRDEGVTYKPREGGKKVPKKKDYEGHRFQKSIEKAIKAKVMNGYDEFTFKPDEPLTRGQYAEIMNRLGQLDEALKRNQ